MESKKIKYDILTEPNDIDYSLVTKKRLSSNKWMVIACGCITLLCDIITIIMLAEYSAKYMVLPIILLVVDVLFVASAFFTNFKFKYSFYSIITYLALSIVLTLIMLMIPTASSAHRYMTSLSFAVIFVSHLLLYLAILFSSYLARKPKNAGNLTSFTFVAVASSLVVIAYLLFSLFMGFWGQGYGLGSGVRAVTFSFDTENQYYVATGVLDGKGDTVIIPETFNGKPVEVIDGRIFSSKGITTLRIENDELLQINWKNFFSVNSDLSIEVKKDLIDDYRMMAFEKADGMYVPYIVRLMNKFVPYDLPDDEVFITFAYDESFTVPEIVKSQLVQTWIQPTGTKFEITDLEVFNDYLDYNDVKNESHLAWNYTNNDGFILQPLVDKDGNSVHDKTITKSLSGVKIDFEKIYKVSLTNGNDGLYSVPESWKKTTLGTTTFAGRYFTKDNAQEFVDSLPKRAGFDVDWFADNDELSGTVINKKFVLEYLDKYPTLTEIALEPMWRVKNPIINSISSNKAGNIFVYGDTINLSSDVVGHGITLEYTLKKDSNVIFGSQADGNFELLHYLPSHSGNYTLEVVAKDSLVSELVSDTITKNINLVINKKTLGFVWGITNYVYDGNDKYISCVHNTQDVVYDDEISFDYSLKNVKNVSYYYSEIELLGDTAQNYAVKLGNKIGEFNILPAQIDVVWGENSFIYSGAPQVPQANATAIGADELGLQVGGAKTNVGNFTASATITNSNYQLRNPQTDFVIEKKAITISWKDDEFVYNGQPQRAEVETVTGAVLGEENYIINSLSYTGWQNNIYPQTEQYEVFAELPAQSNYKFVLPQNNQYSILKRAITVNWETNSFVYNGTSQIRKIVGFVNVLEKDLADVWDTIIVSGGGTNVGTYSTQAILPTDTYYTFEVEQIAEFSITPKALSIRAEDKTKTYDNSTYQAGFSYQHTGLAGGDLLSEVATINIIGEAISAVNYSVVGYSIVLEISQEKEKFGNYNITLNSGLLQIERKPITITAIGGTKEYDNTPFTDFDFSASAPASGDTMTDIADIGYSGAGTTAVNYSASAYAVSPYVVSQGVKFANYAITLINGQVRIEKRVLSVVKLSAPEISKVYDGTTTTTFVFANNVDYALSGTIANQIVGANYTASYNLQSTNATHIRVTFGGLKTGLGYIASNYSYTTGTTLDYDASITPKAITITAIGGTKQYDGLPFTVFSYSVSTLASGDSMSQIAVIGYSGVGTTAVDYSASAYAVLPYVVSQGTKFANYDFTMVAGSVKIDKNNSENFVWETLVFDFDGATKSPQVVTSGQPYSSDCVLGDYQFFDSTGVSIAGAPSEIGEYYVKILYTSNNYEIGNDYVWFEIIDAE